MSVEQTIQRLRSSSGSVVVQYDDLTALLDVAEAARGVVKMLDESYPELLTDEDWPEGPRLAEALAAFASRSDAA